MFGENGHDLATPSKCCDVSETYASSEDKLKILIDAIDELGRMGEVKITEWSMEGRYLGCLT